MVKYIYSNELYHFGRSKRDGAPGPGTGNWRRTPKYNHEKYYDLTLTPYGVLQYRKLNKKYVRAKKKVAATNQNANLKEYRTFKPDPHNVKYAYDEKKKVYGQVQDYKPDRPKYIAQYKNPFAKQEAEKANKKKKSDEDEIKPFTSNDAFTYNMQYYKALEKHVKAKNKQAKIEKKIKDLTGLNAEDANEIYGKKSKISPYYARNLLNDYASRYTSYLIKTDKSQAKAYRKGVRDLEKLFPESLATINEEYAEFLRSLED